MREGEWIERAKGAWVYYTYGKAPNKVLVNHIREKWKVSVWIEEDVALIKRWMDLPLFDSLEEAKVMGLMAYKAINNG